MKTKLMLTAIVLNCMTLCFGQQNQQKEKWNWLIGEWKGEGDGQTGKGGGTFSIKPDLDNKVLIRRNHAEYPATATQPKVVHDDLMIVYNDISGAPSNAIYFDNEGHTINYTISYADKSIMLTSDKQPNTPVFRLTYTLNDAGSISVKFDMSRDGEKFTTYTEGKCTKVEKNNK